MRVSRWLLPTVLALVVVFVAYQAVAVFGARAKTAALFAPYTSAAASRTGWNSLTPERQAALIAVEDPAFFDHRGVDFVTPGAGMTTITQALVKRLYFERFRPGFAKIEQTLIAWLAVNPLVAKETQLNAFLSIAYMGHKDGREIRGFDAASRAYFGKPLARLQRREYLALVAMLIAPNGLRPDTMAAENARRVTRIEKLLKGDCAPAALTDLYYGAC